MTTMVHLRETHNVSFASEQLDEFLQIVNDHGFKRAAGYGRRVGGSLERNNLSEYEYINTHEISLKHNLRTPLKNIAKNLNIRDHMITHNLLKLNPGDFLDWQDYYMWKQRYQKFGNEHIRGPMTNFFSIALTNGNVVEFKDDIINVPKYHGIVFHPSDIHRTPIAEEEHVWLVFGIPDHLDVGELIKSI